MRLGQRRADSGRAAPGPRRRRAARPAGRRNAAAVRAALAGPRPGMASSTDRLAAPRALRRCPVIAKRCASSRTRWIRRSAIESGGSIRSAPCGRRKKRRSWPGPAVGALGDADDGQARISSSSSTVRRPARAGPAPPSISSTSGTRHLALADARKRRSTRLAQRAVVVARATPSMLKRRYSS